MSPGPPTVRRGGRVTHGAAPVRGNTTPCRAFLQGRTELGGDPMPETNVMPFGKHLGKPVAAIDSGYLAWVLRECRNAPPALLDAIRHELAHRREAGRPA